MTDRQWQSLDETIRGMSEHEKVELIRRVTRSLAPMGYPELLSAADVLRQVDAIVAMPLESEADGFSGEDHDRILYDHP